MLINKLWNTNITINRSWSKSQIEATEFTYKVPPRKECQSWKACPKKASREYTAGLGHGILILYIACWIYW